MDEPVNLDYVASQCAWEIVGADKDAKTLDILATKTLGVLQEQGVYAMMLFLLSRSKEEERTSKSMRSSLYHVLEKINIEKTLPKGTILPKETTEPNEILKLYSEMTKNLETLLLIRTLYEKILIYTRYGAKAAQKEGEKEEKK